MPLRGDFDVEYDNDAELLLAEMEFNGKIINILSYGKEQSSCKLMMHK